MTRCWKVQNTNSKPWHKQAVRPSHFSKLLNAGMLLACVSLLPLSSTAAQAQTLNESAALQLFYEHNLDLLAARYNVETFQAKEIIAAAIPNPIVTVEILELSRNTNSNSSSQGCPQTGSCGPAEYYTFNQLIEMAGHRGLRMESSAIATQAAESDFRDAVRIFSNIVRDNYYALLQAQKNRWLTQEIVNHYRDIVHNSQLRLQAGAIAESEFMRINVEALQAQTDLENALAAVAQAQAALAKILNLQDKSTTLVADETFPNFKNIGQTLPRETLTQMALAQRPDLLGDKQRADQAEKMQTLANRLNYPDVTINGGFARDPGNTVLNSSFIGVSAPVPIFYQHKGETRQADVNLDKSRLAAEQTELAIRNDIVSALAAWNSAEHVVTLYESKMLNRAKGIRDRIELAFSKGATNIMTLIDAQREYKTVMLNYNTALINRVNAYYDLAKALGIEPNADLAQQLDSPDKIKTERLRQIN